MTLLAIDWSGVFVKAGEFILSFGILVILHELGHFIPAKLFKCRVEKFYLFFNPWFSLWKKKKGETEYGIGWVPFGGYVKIAGMIDESMDKAQLNQPAQPWEFRSKPAWQRLIIMIGGVTVNVILAIVIFIMIMWVWGEEYLPVKNLTYGIYADSLAKQIGIKTGDNIVGINGNPIENFNKLQTEIIVKEAKTLQVVRDGKAIDIAVPDGFINKLNKNKLDGFVEANFPTIVDSVMSEAVFTKGTLQKGDTIIGMNNEYYNNYYDFANARDLYKNKVVDLKVIRGKDSVTISCLLKNGKVGFFPVTPDKMFGTEVKKYSFNQSVPVGFKKCFETLSGYIAGIKQAFKNPNENLGSVISIGKIYPNVWNWQKFWTLTAIFSIILAFMNILPIPALDGGHALFTIVEIVTGRKPSDKLMEYAQMVGMVLLLSLMAYALGLDFMRLFR